MSEPFLGQITVFPYNFAPYGWMDCSGQTLAISQYAALFSLLGTTYGGNGTSTFQLPNLQGRVPVGQGVLSGTSSDYAMGEEGGAETVTVTASTMPLHTHTLNASTATGTTNNPSGQMTAAPKVSTGSKGASSVFKGLIYNPAAPNTALAPTAVGTVGSSLPHDNTQPSLVLRYCIAMQGVFPTRG